MPSETVGPVADYACEISFWLYKDRDGVVLLVCVVQLVMVGALAAMIRLGRVMERWATTEALEMVTMKWIVAIEGAVVAVVAEQALIALRIQQTAIGLIESRTHRCLALHHSRRY